MEWIDIAKGFGIIFVVYGHAMGPENKYVYLFHLPLFMILSGYVYNDRDSFFRYVWKKILTIYIPFVSINIIVMLIRMVYAMANGFWNDLAANRIEAMWQTLLCLNKDAGYLAATWYLGALFLISVAYRLVDMIIPDFRFRQYVILAIFAAIAVYGFYNTLPLLQSRTLILSFFFALGRFLKVEVPGVFRIRKLLIAILFGTLFWTLGHFDEVVMATNKYNNRVLFVICACLGSFTTIIISGWLEDRKLFLFIPLKKLLSLLGRYSMDILIWHFVAFRLVVMYQLYLEGEPLLKAIDIGSRYNTDGMWWLLYMLAGIIVSLLWSALLRVGPWGRLLKKLHIIRP